MADQDSNKINHPLALSSSTAPWWDLHHHATRPALSTSARNSTAASVMNLWETHNNLNTYPCDHEDVSKSASNVSNFTIDESSHRLVGTQSSNYIIREAATDNKSPLWSQLLLGIEGTQEMRMNEMGENLLNAHSLKRFSGGRFESSACGEYLRKLDNHHNENWAEINGTNELFTNNLDKESINSNAGYNGDSISIENNNDHHRSLYQSQMVQHAAPLPCNNNISSVDQSFQPDVSSDLTRQSLVFQPQLFDVGPTSNFICENSGLSEMGQENDQRRESELVGSIPATLFPMASFINTNDSAYMPIGNTGRPREINMLSQHGYPPSVIDPFSSRFSNKLFQNSVSLCGGRKQQGTLGNSLISKGKERGQGPFVNEGKKRSEGALQSISSLKKPKRDNSGSYPSTAISPVKMTSTRTPKGKVEAEKLSSLQQIVSPYGKTDTASILQEAIGFIRRHQENVQMLCNQYLKSTFNKRQEAWGIFDMKGEKNKVLDLKSKGLCLVPISSIPKKIQEENLGLDYWPEYRGCLYR